MKKTAAQAEKSTDAKRRSLLVFDRNALLRWSVQTHLREWFDVETADTAEDAKAAIQRHRFDALVVSVNGRPSDGVEEAARAANENVAVVRLVTGCEPVAHPPEVTCLEKPFRLDALARALGVG